MESMLSQKVLHLIKDNGGWLSGVMKDGSLHFDFSSSSITRKVEEELGKIPGWDMHSFACVIFMYPEKS